MITPIIKFHDLRRELRARVFLELVSNFKACDFHSQRSEINSFDMFFRPFQSRFFARLFRTLPGKMRIGVIGRARVKIHPPPCAGG